MLVEDGNLVIPNLDDYGVPAEQGKFLRRLGRIPIRPDLAVGRAVIEGTVQHVDDLLADGPPPDQVGTQIQRVLGIRTFLAVPMRREGATIGVIVAWRTEPRPFTTTQIELLKTLAAQAALAIENVRLFSELKEKNEALTQAHAQVTEALDQQTATSEVLQVISSSPTDIQPVLNTVAASSARLCEAQDTHIYLVDGDVLRLAAHYGPLPSGVVGESTLPLIRGTLNGRAVIERRVAQIADVQNEVQEFPEGAASARRYGHRTALIVPLLREGVAIGTISLRRAEVRLFSERQVALLQTFADQAVIAIENVRLFTELQASNRELTTALDKQTATSDILRVISQSQTDVQPVFDAILASAVRLLAAYSGVLTRIVGDQIVLAALTRTDGAGDAATRALFPQALQSELSKTGQWDKMAAGYAQVIRERAPLNIADVHTDPRWPETARAYARLRGYRSWAAVPLI